MSDRHLTACLLVCRLSVCLSVCLSVTACGDRVQRHLAREQTPRDGGARSVRPRPRPAVGTLQMRAVGAAARPAAAPRQTVPRAPLSPPRPPVPEVSHLPIWHQTAV